LATLEYSQYKARSCGLIMNARRRVYLMQASISPSVYEYFEEYFKVARDQIVSIQNLYRNESKLTLTNSVKITIDFVKDQVAQGKLPLIVTDTDNCAIAERLFGDIGVKMEMINSANTDKNQDVAIRIQQILGNGHIPVCSPVITTGVDLHIPGISTVGIYNQTAQILTGETIRQQIARNRDAEEILVFISKRTPNKVTKRQLCNKFYDRMNQFALRSPDTQWVFESGEIKLRDRDAVSQAASIMA